MFNIKKLKLRKMCSKIYRVYLTFKYQNMINVQINIQCIFNIRLKTENNAKCALKYIVFNILKMK